MRKLFGGLIILGNVAIWILAMALLGWAGRASGQSKYASFKDSTGFMRFIEPLPDLAGRNIEINGKVDIDTLNLSGVLPVGPIADSIAALRADIGSAMRLVADTTALKLLTAGSPGEYRYLKELSSGSGIGGGWFVSIDSTYPEGIIAFGCATAGKQLARVDWITDKGKINIQWAGAGTARTSTQNSTAMEAAASFLRSQGRGMLYIPTGLYLIERRFIIDWDDAGLVGDGRDVSIIRRSPTFNRGASYSGFVDVGNTGAIIYVHYADHVTIRDLTVDANFQITTPEENGNGMPIAYVGSPYGLVQNVHVKDINQHTYGIWFKDGSNHSSISYCWVNGDTTSPLVDPGAGVELIEIGPGGIHDITVDHCILYGGLDGVNIFNTIGHTQDISVTNCEISQFTRYGIVVNRYSNGDTTNLFSMTLKDNIIDSCRLAGIVIDNVLGPPLLYTPAPYGFVISGNTIRNSGKAIYTVGVNDVTISDNKIYDCGVAGSLSTASIYCTTDSNLTIKNNDIYRSKDHGIFAVVARRLRIEENNIISPTLNGTWVNQSDEMIVSRNFILNANNADSTTVTQGLGYGMFFHTMGDSVALIDGNLVYDSRSTKKMRIGIFAQGGYQGANTKVRHNVVKGFVTSAFGGGIPGNVEISAPMILGNPNVTDSMLNVEKGVNFEKNLRVGGRIFLGSDGGTGMTITDQTAIRSGVAGGTLHMDIGTLQIRSGVSGVEGEIVVQDSAFVENYANVGWLRQRKNTAGANSNQLLANTFIHSMLGFPVNATYAAYAGLRLKNMTNTEINATSPAPGDLPYSTTDLRPVWWDGSAFRRVVSSNDFKNNDHFVSDTYGVTIDTTKWARVTTVGGMIKDSIATHAVNPDTSDDFKIGAGDTLRIRYKVPDTTGNAAKFLRGDLSWQTVAGGAGDIEGVTAGDGLQGGGTSGTVTVNASPKALGGLKVTTDSLEVDSSKYFSVYAGSLKSDLTAVLKNADSTSIRNYSNSLYLKNADSTSIRNYSNSLYLKNADSTSIRNYSNALYLAKSTILVQNGTGTDSVFITTTYRIPLGYSTGIVLDSIVYVGMASTARNTKCKIAYGIDQSAAGTLVDTTTVTANTSLTKQSGANIDAATIPAGNFIWLEFPTVTTAFKTIVAYGIGHKQ